MTPDRLRKLSDEQLLQLLEKLAARFYGNLTWVEKLAADIGVAKSTIYRWKNLEAPVPWPVIYTLYAWTHTEAFSVEVNQDWEKITAQLSEAASSMSRAASTLSRLALRFPAADPAS